MPHSKKTRKLKHVKRGTLRTYYIIHFIAVMCLSVALWGGVGIQVAAILAVGSCILWVVQKQMGPAVAIASAEVASTLTEKDLNTAGLSKHASFFKPDDEVRFFPKAEELAKLGFPWYAQSSRQEAMVISIDEIKNKVTITFRGKVVAVEPAQLAKKWRDKPDMLGIYEPY